MMWLAWALACSFDLRGISWTILLLQRHIATLLACFAAHNIHRLVVMGRLLNSTSNIFSSGDGEESMGTYGNKTRAAHLEHII